MECPQNTKMRTRWWSGSPTTGYVSKGCEIGMLRRYYIPMFFAAFTLVKIWDQPKWLSVDNR